jgi:hypothetical protein
MRIALHVVHRYDGGDRDELVGRTLPAAEVEVLPA